MQKCVGRAPWYCLSVVVLWRCSIMHATCLARRPKTNWMASITLDFPLPLGPTTLEKDCHTHAVGVSVL